MESFLMPRLRLAVLCLFSAFLTAAVAEPGDPVGPVRTISLDPAAAPPSAAANASGRTVILHAGTNDGLNELRAHYEYPPRGEYYVGTPESISIERGYDAIGGAAVAMSREGHWMAAWEQHDGATATIRARLFTGIYPHSYSEVASPFGSHAVRPAVAADPYGTRYAVAWALADAEGHALQARFYDASQNRLGEAVTVGRLADALRAPAVAQENVQSGDTLFVWRGPLAPGGSPVILAQRFDLTTPVSPATVVTDAADTDSRLDVAFAPFYPYGVAVAYVRGTTIAMRLLDAQLGVGPEVIIADDSAQGSVPHVAGTIEGEFIIGWVATDGSIRTRSVSQDGTTPGPTKTIVTSSLMRGDAGFAFDGDGDGVTTWAEQGGGVFARRMLGREPVDLLVATNVVPESILPAAEFSFAIDIANNWFQPGDPLDGHSTVTGLVARITPPPGASLASVYGQRWHCEAGPVVECAYDDVLHPHEYAELLRVYFVAPATPGMFEGSVAVAANQRENNSEDNVEIVPVLIGDSDPDPFTLTAVTGAPRSTRVVSSPVVIDGITVPVDISVSTGGEYSLNGGPFTAARGTAVRGDSVRVAHTSAASFYTVVDTYITVGARSEQFRSTTEFEDGTPDAFAFADVAGVARAVTVESGPIRITGLNTAVAVNVTGGEYSVDGAPWRSASTVIGNAAEIRVRHVSAAGFDTMTQTRLSVGTGSATFTSRTLARDVTPDAFEFVAATSVPRNASIASNEITVAGINDPAAITVSGGEYSMDGGVFLAAPGAISNNQRVRVRLTSASGFSAASAATLTIGGITGTFTATTEAEDRTPEALTFPAKTGVQTNVLVTSDPVTITGINTTVLATPTTGEMSVNGGVFSASSSQVTSGDQVRLRHTSSSSASTSATTTISIGTVSASFVSTTGSVDTTPNAFQFVDVPNAKRNSRVTSAAVAIGGINAPVPIAVSGGGAQYSINGGAYTSAPGSVASGAAITLRITTPNVVGVTTDVVVTIGGTTDTWSVTTR
jgi:hypothetical protein